MAQRRNRRVSVYLNPETFSQLEMLAERNGNITQSSMISVAIAHMYRAEVEKKPARKKAPRAGEST